MGGFLRLTGERGGFGGFGGVSLELQGFSLELQGFSLELQGVPWFRNGSSDVARNSENGIGKRKKEIAQLKRSAQIGRFQWVISLLS